MDKHIVKQLIEQYQRGTLSAEERILLEKWYLDLSNQPMPEISHQEITSRLDQTLHSLQTAIGHSPKKQSISRQLIYWSAAAAIAGLFTIAYLFYTPVTKETGETPGQYTGQIQPGTNSATIRIANGKTIQLSGTQNTASISGERISDQEGKAVESLNEQNITLTASTPKGGTYTFNLSDGTKVTLNADSRLTFPSGFSGKERRVQIQGEGYFQVAKDKTRPFIVESGNQQVKVLGTKFNINSYQDEAGITTTLEEGSIEIASADQQQRSILSPGQQANYNQENIRVKQADLEEALSWKDGYFRLKDESIESIMRKIARWYNVEVIYQGAITKELLNGKISKYKSITEVLDMLSSTKTIKFKIEGRRITVME